MLCDRGDCCRRVATLARSPGWPGRSPPSTPRSPGLTSRSPSDSASTTMRRSCSACLASVPCRQRRSWWTPAVTCGRSRPSTGSPAPPGSLPPRDSGLGRDDRLKRARGSLVGYSSGVLSRGAALSGWRCEASLVTGTCLSSLLSGRSTRERDCLPVDHGAAGGRRRDVSSVEGAVTGG